MTDLAKTIARINAALSVTAINSLVAHAKPATAAEADAIAKAAADRRVYLASPEYLVKLVRAI